MARRLPSTCATACSLIRGATLEDTPEPRAKLVNLAERFGIQLDEGGWVGGWVGGRGRVEGWCMHAACYAHWSSILRY